MDIEDNFEQSFRNQTGTKYNTFYLSYRPKLVWHLMKMCKSNEQAEQVADEAFHKGIEEFNKFNAEIAQYSTWLFTIARRLMLHDIKLSQKTTSIDQYFDGSNIKEFLIADTYYMPYEEDITSRKANLIRNTIPKLPKKYAKVLMMREIDGLAYQDISDYLDLNLATVKSQIRQGREMLRKRVERDIKRIEKIYS